MKAFLAIIFSLMFVVSAYGGVIDEAKQANSDETHKVLVEKAQKLLKAREQMQDALTDIENQLYKLNNGENIKIDTHTDNGCSLTTTSIGTMTFH